MKKFFQDVGEMLLEKKPIFKKRLAETCCFIIIALCEIVVSGLQFLTSMLEKRELEKKSGQAS